MSYNFDNPRGLALAHDPNCTGEGIWIVRGHARIVANDRTNPWEDSRVDQFSSYVPRILRPGSWSIATKLVALALLCSVIPLAIVGWFIDLRGSAALLDQQGKALEAVRTSRQNTIQAYFYNLREQVRYFGESSFMLEAMAKFAAAFRAVPDQVKQITRDDRKIYQDLEKFYSNEFQTQFQPAGIPRKGAPNYIPDSPAARLLQLMFIVQNPHPLGQKENLETVPTQSDYTRIHAQYHPFFRRFLSSFGFHDIFLLDLDGNLVYSATKGVDFATNFCERSVPRQQSRHCLPPSAAGVGRRTADRRFPGL